MQPPPRRLGDQAGLLGSLADQQDAEAALAGQVLIYPGLGGDMSKGSYITHAEAPMLTLRDLTFYGNRRAGGRDVSRE